MEEETKYNGDEPQPRLDIVIPYIELTIVWEEIKFALRSIAKNANFNYRLFMVAEKLPGFVNPDAVTLIKCAQVKGIPFSKAYDQYTKLKAIINHPDVSEKFVYAYDDQLWCQPVDEKTLMVLRATKELKSEAEIIKEIPRAGRNWRACLINSVNALLAENKACFNYEIHMPRVFQKSLMKELFEKFELDKNSQTLVSTLYFNYFYEKRPTLLNKNGTIKGEIKEPLTESAITEIITRSKFVDYKNAAVNKNFKKVVSETFSEKSFFEK